MTFSFVRAKWAVFAFAFLVGLASLGGCPSQRDSGAGPTDATGALGGDNSGGTAGAVEGSTGVTAGDTSINTSAEDTSTGDDDTTSGTGDTETTTSADGYSNATIIHKGAGGFLVDAAAGIPANAGFNETNGYKTGVQLARLSSDGSTVWFTTGDGNGFITPQLFCMNTDGTNLQEISLPADMVELPSEIWPSADGQTCAVLMDPEGDGYAWSKSVFLLASRTTGTMTTLYDARGVESGENDYNNLQMSGDGSTLYFRGWDTRIIYSLPSTGGTPQVFATPSAFTRTGSTVDGPLKFRINCDASAMVVLVNFENPDNSWPKELYLIDNNGVTQLTNTGDIWYSNNNNWVDMGISADGRYVVYRHRTSSDQPWLIERMDRVVGGTITLSTVYNISLDFQTLISCDGTVVTTAKGLPDPGGSKQAPGVFTLDGSSSLQFHDAWVQAESRPVRFNSVSGAGGVYAGVWNNGAFGDKNRLYLWFPGVASFRSGPSIQKVEYKLDDATATLAVRVTASGSVTGARMVGLYDGFESIYQLAEAEDAFYSERFGQDMSESTETAGVYQHTATFDGLTLDDHYRVRVGVFDDTNKNYAYVDFRPVPRTGETHDTNADGVSD